MINFFTSPYHIFLLFIIPLSISSIINSELHSRSLTTNISPTPSSHKNNIWHRLTQFQSKMFHIQCQRNLWNDTISNILRVESTHTLRIFTFPIALSWLCTVGNACSSHWDNYEVVSWLSSWKGPLVTLYSMKLRNNFWKRDISPIYSNILC